MCLAIEFSTKVEAASTTSNPNDLAESDLKE